MSSSAAPAIDFQTAREYMVERQVRTWDVLDPKVLEVMGAMPREHFVPAQYRSLAYADAQVPLGSFDGRDEFMMQPKVEGRLLQALSIRKSDRILEIGTGSGWLTALLAQLGDQVRSLDIRAEFTDYASRALDGFGVHNVTLETRDAATLEGIDEDFDCIVVTASMPQLHESFRRRLKAGGRLFAIVGTDPIMEAQLHTRAAENAWSVDSLFDTAIPPLVNAWNPGRFQF